LNPKALHKLSKPRMTYDYYHEVKRRTTPKTAPSYVRETGGAPKSEFRKVE
jgi:hypothetical protein